MLTRPRASRLDTVRSTGEPETGLTGASSDSVIPTRSRPAMMVPPSTCPWARATVRLTRSSRRIPSSTSRVAQSMGSELPPDPRSTRGLPSWQERHHALQPDEDAGGDLGWGRSALFGCEIVGQDSRVCQALPQLPLLGRGAVL